MTTYSHLIYLTLYHYEFNDTSFSLAYYPDPALYTVSEGLTVGSFNIFTHIPFA